MWFEFKVALRFLRSGGVQTVLIVAGIVIGVGVQIFLGFLIGGLQEDLLDQTVGTSPHLMVMNEDTLPRPVTAGSEEKARTVTFTGRELNLSGWRELAGSLREDPRVTAVSPTVTGSGFALRGQRREPVVFRGVELEAADEIYRISSRLTAGEARLEGSSILVGEELAAELDLNPGDILQLATGSGVEDRFYVGGIFDLGSREQNESWIFLSRQRASSFLNLGDDISLLEMQIEDVFAARGMAEEFTGRWPELTVENWQDNNQQLLTGLESQSRSSLVIQFFVIVAVTLGIASVLAVSVAQKSRQIGILKAMGLKRSRVARIFLLQGGLIGSAGALLGSLAGYGLTQLFVNLASNEAGEPLFPLQVEPGFLLISLVVAVLAGMIAAVIPARSSARLDPIEVIQNG
ncbi:MAG: ABC transporter permease [Bacillota bacterium]